MNDTGHLLLKAGSLALLLSLLMLLTSCVKHHEQSSSNQISLSTPLSSPTTAEPAKKIEPSDGDAVQNPSEQVEGQAKASSEISRSKAQVVQKSVATKPEIGMEELVERLKKTEAIGVFTKLAIRSDVLDFKESIDTYRKKGELEKYVGHLRDHFDGLLLKILALLERDPPLSRDIQHARESIWRSFLEAKS